MRILCLIVLLLIFVGQTGAQEIQVKEVLDFSGGYVNALSNARMQDNQALVLTNFDVTPIGNLTRRPGMSLHFTDTLSGSAMDQLYQFTGNLERKLLTSRIITGSFGHDSASDQIQVLTFCDPTQENCTTFVWPGLYNHHRDRTYPYHSQSAMQNGRLFIATSKSELFLYDGDKAIPARPFAAGQPKVDIAEGGGNVTGVVRYRYCYIDTTAQDTSNFSPPSFPVKVQRGKVYVYDMAPPLDTTIQDQIALFRETEGSNLFEHVATWSVDSSGTQILRYFDTTGSTNDADTLLYRWGPRDHYESYKISGSCPCPDTPFYAPPGGLKLTSTFLDTVNGVEMIELGLDTICNTIGYSVVFIDSAGRHSYPSTPTVTLLGCYNPADTGWVTEIHDIPLPQDSGILKKLLLRYFPFQEEFLPASTDDTTAGRMLVVDTLEPEDSVYYDSAYITDLDSFVEYCDCVLADSIVGFTDWVGDTTDFWYHCADDSAITFRPEMLALHGSQLYAAGHHVYPNRLFYSEFGRGTTWPFDKYQEIPSAEGDWINGLLSWSDALLIFRQNSVMALSGLSFYQYRLEDIAVGIGLTARNTLAASKSAAYFAHQTGLYQVGLDVPLSITIDRTVDSAGSKLQRSVGRLVGKDYWWSLPIGTEQNSTTYIFSEIPSPHWKAYDFGLFDSQVFDWDTLAVDFNSTRWVILRDNDSLYRWDPIGTDTTDDTTHFIAEYQSKYFFEGGGRERILWVDVAGTGTVDSLQLLFYRDYQTTPFDSVVIAPNFTDLERDRVSVSAVCENFSLKIRDRGSGDYTLKGYQIGYLPWDGGKK